MCVAVSAESDGVQRIASFVLRANVISVLVQSEKSEYTEKNTWHALSGNSSRGRAVNPGVQM